MTFEELLAENIRLRARVRELEQENARLKGYGSSSETISWGQHRLGG